MKDKMIRILNTIIGKLEDSRNSRQEVIDYIKIVLKIDFIIPQGNYFY